MRRFAELFVTLDSTTRTSEKVEALVRYFQAARPADAAWAIHVLGGRKLRQIIPTRLLRQWAAEAAEIPVWLFDESYDAVGDLAEAISLIVPPGTANDDRPLAEMIENFLMPLRGQSEDVQREAILRLWERTTREERLVVLKLMTGSFRVGVSATLVTRGVAEAAGIPAETVAHRLMGNWYPSEEFFTALVDPDIQDTRHSQPYPFCLAHPIDMSAGPESLGHPGAYLAEWKWDGIRGQVIRRAGRTFIWSRGEELMEDRWPEIEAAATHLPDGTVIDGEILAVATSGEVLPFTQLQRRINRKTVGKKLLTEVPVVFYAFDLLESEETDLRGLPLRERRQRLERLVESLPHPAIGITETILGDSWDMLEQVRSHSREKNAEGLMLKHGDSVYAVGRVRGGWWKWKIDPYTIDAVLIYAQPGHGKRANLYTDYTFAVWDDGVLVPFAKAYSGLSDDEIQHVDRFVRTHTRERFGPVRSVDPELVMELAFEGLQASTRHKSGVAVRFPRISRWRHDKRPGDANSLADLLALANPSGSR